jgi:Zn-dependent protease
MPRMFGIDVESLIRVLSVAAIPGILAITLHEVSHGWVAKQLGDPTASMLGRLTINPLKHVDLIGTILVPIGLLVFVPGGPVFGWAKPVPVDTRNLRRRKRDMAIVAAAGPVSNVLMALFWAVLGRLTLVTVGGSSAVSEWVLGMCVFGMFINAVLTIFNLLPIPPLDGGRVLVACLPSKVSDVVERIEPFGLIIVILLVVSGALGSIIDRPFGSLLAFYHSVAGLA